jgi:micrococcal nuclease
VSYRPARRLPLGTVVLGLVLLALVATRLWQDSQQEPTPEVLPSGVFSVERAVDGDTLLLTNGARIRLIGADTPETVKPDHEVEPWGPEATAFTRAFVSGGQVRLEFDRERLDRYGRFLAYVWVDSWMLNEELLRAGLARAEPQFRYSSAMKTRFRQAEAEAKAAHRGIWSNVTPSDVPSSGLECGTKKVGRKCTGMNGNNSNEQASGANRIGILNPISLKFFRFA